MVQPEEQAVQIALPTAEILTSLEEGLGELVRKVGRLFFESVLEAEVEQIAGVRSRRYKPDRRIDRGVEQGSCLIDGQRVPIGAPVSASMRRQGTAAGHLPVVSSEWPGRKNRME